MDRPDIGGVLGWVRRGAGGLIGVRRGEGGEVVGAEDVECSLLQRLQIEGQRAVPDIRGEHGGADIADAPFLRDTGEDAVLVGLAEGAVAGMEPLRSGLDREHADTGWQGAVEGSMEIGGGDVAFEGKGGDLGERMDAGIGATRALGQNDFAGDVLDDLRQSSLDSSKSWLYLPAMKGRAIVGENCLPELHRESWLIT